MDAEGLGRKLLLTLSGDPRRAHEKQTVGTHKMLTLQALSSSLNAGTAKRGCLRRGEAFGCPPAVCPPKRPRPFAHCRRESQTLVWKPRFTEPWGVSLVPQYARISVVFVKQLLSSLAATPISTNRSLALITLARASGVNNQPYTSQPTTQLQRRKTPKPQNMSKIPPRHPNSPYSRRSKKYPENTRKISQNYESCICLVFRGDI